MHVQVKLLIVFVLMAAAGFGHGKELTSATIAKARLTIVATAAYLFQTDNGSAPESFRDITHPTNYLLMVSDRLYPTIWRDPFSLSGEAILFDVTYRSRESSPDWGMPVPAYWKLRSRGADHESSACEPLTMIDDLIIDGTTLPVDAITSQCLEARQLLMYDFGSSDPLLLNQINNVARSRR